MATRRSPVLRTLLVTISLACSKAAPADTVCSLPGLLWSVSEPVEEFGTGDRSDDDTFFIVVNAVRFANGAVAVASRGSQSILVYDTTGSVTLVGQAGEGPGEFRGLEWVGTMGDTLVAFDAGLRRFTLFGLDGEVLDVRTLPPGITGRVPRVVGILTDRTVVMMDHSQPMQHARYGTVTRDSTALVTVRLDADSLRGLPAVPLWDLYATPEIVFIAPFSPRGFVATTTDRILTAFGAEPMIERRNRYGEPTDTMEFPMSGRAVTDAMRDFYVDHRIRSSRAFRRSIRRALAEVPFPEVAPAFDSVLVGADGGVWIEQWSLSTDGPSCWMALDSLGGLAGFIRLPPRFRPHQLGAGWVLGVFADEDDVETVQLRELATAGRGASAR